MAQLTEMLMKLLDFSLRRLRDSQPPRELRIAVSEGGPSLIIALSDSGNPLSVEAEQRLVRSEEHTSELQSRLHLVCRLLLEKKKRRPNVPDQRRTPTRTVLGHFP